MARVTLTRFRLNKSKRGIAGVAVSPKVRDAVHDLAETKAKPYAISVSPDPDTGAYARSFDVKDVTVRGIPRDYPMTRAGAHLVNTDPGATAIEVGTARITSDGQIVATPANRVFRRTLEHLHSTSGVIRRQVRRRR